MKKTFYIFSAVIVLFMVQSLTAYAQQETRLCTLFDRYSNYIEVEVAPDSTSSEFTIVKKGFETKEKQRQALDAFFSNQLGYYPVFYVFYYSLSKPEIVPSPDAVKCTQIVSIDTLRSEELYSSWMYFIKKTETNYLVWAATLEPEE